jgi:hypothetical protein
MATIKKLTRTAWRVTCRGLPQHNTTFKSTSAAKHYATALEAQGMTIQVTKVQTIGSLARVRSAQGYRVMIPAVFQQVAVSKADAQQCCGAALAKPQTQERGVAVKGFPSRLHARCAPAFHCTV